MQPDNCSPPPAAWWARALAAVGNDKFAATRRTYLDVGLAEDGDAVDALVAANVEFVHRYYARLGRLWSVRGRRQLTSAVESSGTAPLRAAVADGRGMVLASAHLGDFDVAGAWLAQTLGREVIVVNDQLTPHFRQTAFDCVRTAAGITLRRRASTSLRTLAVDLHAGAILLWMVDRVAPGPTLTTTFLGRPTQIAAGPLMLARRTGAAVVCGSTTTDRDGTLCLRLAPPLRANVGRTVQPTLDVIAATLTNDIRACPWQWHVPADLGELPSLSCVATARCVVTRAGKPISPQRGSDSIAG
jgi:lauroyl/myristoyl acyltransferase